VRLAYISDYLPRHHSRAGGADWACWRVGELLKKSGHTIDYFTRTADNNVSSDGVHFVPVFENLLPKRFAKYSEALKWYIWQIDPLAFFYFLVKFSWRRPDIVHIHRFRAITMAPLIIARLFKIPVYFSVYDYWMFCALETLIDDKNRVCRRFHGVWCYNCLPRQLVWLQKALLVFRKKVFDWSIKRIDKFFVLSRSSAAILESYGIAPIKIKIIPLPYEERLKELNTQVQAHKDTLLYVGWIQKRKGLDILVSALNSIKKEIPSVKLNVVGPDVVWEKEYRRYVDTLIKDLDLSGTINWFGPQPNERVHRFIQESEIVVVPEQWENMSPVIIGEAMFSQKPVIGSRLGGIPDFIVENKTGFLFEASSPSDLADKILLLLRDKPRAFEMGKAGREAAQEIFSNEAITEKYSNAYLNKETDDVG